MALFAGLDRAHGAFEVTSSRGDGKQTGRADTKHLPVTLRLWERHLAGEEGLGIVPIRDDSTCVFGAIDVDVYSGLDAGALARKAGKLGLPLVPCRSKSGGVHLWLFASDPAPAVEMIARLREIAAVLGLAGSEVFPKQSKLAADMRQVGNWINMPYFGETRRALGIEGGELSAEEFLDFAESSRCPPSFFASPLAAVAGEAAFSDGPPCLQHLARIGFPEGTRNTGLFHIAVYARKARGDGGNWENLVHSLNGALMRPELGHAEVESVIKSAKGKKYGYLCDQSPMRDHCDKALCRARRNGIGAFGAPMPVLGQLTKFDTEPPLWEWEVEGAQLRLTTDEIHDFNKFSKRLLERCHRAVPRMKDEVWRASYLNPALENLRVERMPDDASDEGMLWVYLEKFCGGKAQAQSKAEILFGKPWTDKTAGVTWFRSTDFIRYLQQQRFQNLPSPQQTALFLRSRGAKHKAERLGGGSANLWGVPAFGETPELDVPESILNLADLVEGVKNTLGEVPGAAERAQAERERVSFP